MASMYFRYRDYSHPAGEVQVTSFDISSERNDYGAVTSKTVTMQLSGIIVAAGDVAIDARIAEILSAYSLDGGDAALIRTDGQRSHLTLTSSDSTYGVQVVNGPNFSTERNSAHFATGIPYTITLQAKYDLTGTSFSLGSSETIEQIGDGGPIASIITLDNGPPWADLVSPASPVVVTQSGEATYEVSIAAPATYPNFNPPLFPDNLIRPDGFRVSRSRSRPKLDGKVQYKASWSYSFQFTTPPFIPNPTA